MLRVWLVVLLVCGWVACQPVGPNLPWLVLYNGGYVTGSLDASSISTAATLCATIRAVQLATPRPQHLVYIGNYSNGDGFGFGLDENFNIVVWQGGAGNASTSLAITPGVTNLICVAYSFFASSTTARAFAYQPSFQNQQVTFSTAKVTQSARIYVGGWGDDTYTGFINNVQVYTEAFSASQDYKFSFDWKIDTIYNLLASYPFREGAGSTVYNHAGTGSPLTIQGDHSWHQRFLNSLALTDASSVITLPVPATFSGDVTIAMWLKIGQAFTANKADVFVLNNLTAFYDPLANKFGVTANTTTYTFTQYDVPFNTWIYVAFQVESSAGYVKLFVNKVQKDVYTGYPGDTNVPTMTIGGGHYGALGASIASIQLWASITPSVWGVGFSRINLANGDTSLAAYYNLGETNGTTIYNWYTPPSQGQLTGQITWTPIPENALNLSPSDTVSFATGQNLPASTNTQFTFAMNIYWRAPTLTATSVIANIGDFPGTGFGLVIDTTGTLGLNIGFNSGLPAKFNAITQMPSSKTVSLVVKIDFNAGTVTAILDGTSYQTTGLTQTYVDLTNVNVYLGRPSASWNTYTGFDGLISDFQIWKGLRNNVFYTGDLTKNALVSALNPFLYAPLNDNNGAALEVMTGTLGTVAANLSFATFPDRTSQFEFIFPVYTPDGTLVPITSPSYPGTPSAPGAGNPSIEPANNNVTPPADGVKVEVIVPAIVVPVVVVAVGLIVLLVLLKRRKKGPKEEKKAVTIENPVNDVESARANFAENRSTSYSNIPLQRVVASNNETSRNVDKLLNLAMRDRLNIPHEKIKFIEEIGSGSFGKVYKGDWQHCEVAVKVANVISNMDSFIQEAELMMAIRPHPNVVQLLGVSVDGGSPEMVLEFCPSGSLDTLLQSQVPLSDEQKIKLSLGIARGMLHLHLNNVIHRDLAARNILLSKDGQPKISDFGMSRVLGEDVSHTGQTRSYVGPIKWMAPEALREAIYGRKTDVWSYGITVWEIVTRKEPFEGIDLIQAALVIRDQGVTPEIPKDCPDVLRELMHMCWQQNPESRPEFEDICKFLQKEVK